MNVYNKTLCIINFSRKFCMNWSVTIKETNYTTVFSIDYSQHTLRWVNKGKFHLKSKVKYSKPFSYNDLVFIDLYEKSIISFSVIKSFVSLSIALNDDKSHWLLVDKTSW